MTNVVLTSKNLCEKKDVVWLGGVEATPLAGRRGRRYIDTVALAVERDGAGKLWLQVLGIDNETYTNKQGQTVPGGPRASRSCKVSLADGIEMLSTALAGIEAAKAALTTPKAAAPKAPAVAPAPVAPAPVAVAPATDRLDRLEARLDRLIDALASTTPAPVAAAATATDGKLHCPYDGCDKSYVYKAAYDRHVETCSHRP